MDSFKIFAIYSVSFLDSLCFGLVMPVLAPQILSVGGCHTVLGILASLQILLQNLAGPLTRSLSDKIGKKQALLVELFLALATNALLGYTSTHWDIFILRCIFYLTNQTQTLCKSIVCDNFPEESQAGMFSIMGALGSLGFVIGPIAGGQLYESPDGFLQITHLTVAATLISILFTVVLPSAVKTHEETTSFREKISEDLGAFKTALTGAILHEDLDILLPPILLAVSLTTFFSKFSVLLRIHYQGTASMIGYTIAYHSVIMFISNFVSVIVKQKLQPENTLKTRLQNLTGLLLATFGVCFATTYTFYLVSFVALSLMQNLVNLSQKDICQSRNKDRGDVLGKASSAFALTSSIVTPLFLGASLDSYGYYAIKAFAILPLSVTLFAVYTFRTQAVIKEKVVNKDD